MYCKLHIDKNIISAVTYCQALYSTDDAFFKISSVWMSSDITINLYLSYICMYMYIQVQCDVVTIANVSTSKHVEQTKVKNCSWVFFFSFSEHCMV